MCVWLEKNTVLFICIHERVISIVFAVSVKFFYESGLAILNLIAWLNKWDLMMSGSASLAVISFIKNWHKKLRLLVDLRIFSKFQGA